MSVAATGEAAAWSSLIKRISGISNVSVASDAGYVGTSFDNTELRSQYADVSVSWKFDVAPAANKQLRVYLQFQSDDESTWEDGDTTTEPTTRLIGTIDTAVDTIWHRRVFPMVELSSRPLRFVVWNDGAGQTATVSLDFETYSD